jgi:hypothetical protein
MFWWFLLIVVGLCVASYFAQKSAGKTRIGPYIKAKRKEFPWFDQWMEQNKTSGTALAGNLSEGNAALGVFIGLLIALVGGAVLRFTLKWNFTLWPWTLGRSIPFFVTSLTTMAAGILVGTLIGVKAFIKPPTATELSVCPKCRCPKAWLPGLSVDVLECKTVKHTETRKQTTTGSQDFASALAHSAGDALNSYSKTYYWTIYKAHAEADYSCGNCGNEEHLEEDFDGRFKTSDQPTDKEIEDTINKAAAWRLRWKYPEDQEAVKKSNDNIATVFGFIVLGAAALFGLWKFGVVDSVMSAFSGGTRLQNGVYSFSPRLRVAQDGKPQNLYLDRIGIRGRTFRLFFTGGPDGTAGYGDYDYFWLGQAKVSLTNLDSPEKTYHSNKRGQDDPAKTGGFWLEFPGVSGTRFSLTSTAADPPWVIDEIILTSPAASATGTVTSDTLNFRSAPARTQRSSNN